MIILDLIIRIVFYILVPMYIYKNRKQIISDLKKIWNDED